MIMFKKWLMMGVEMKKALATEMKQVDSVVKDAQLFQGLVDRAKEDGVRSKGKHMEAIVKLEQACAEKVEALLVSKRMTMERIHNELVLL